MKKLFAVLLVFTLILSGCFSKRAPGQNQNPQQKDPYVERAVSLYFSDGGLNLVEEKRSIKMKQSEMTEKKVVEELIKGPASSELKPTIPNGTKLNNVTVEKDIAVVDLSEELIKNHWGGSEMEEQTVYSIVDSLTSLPNIKKVRFLIDGKTREVFSHMELDEDFERDDSLIKK